jgi:hypothetical protein
MILMLDRKWLPIKYPFYASSRSSVNSSELARIDPTIVVRPNSSQIIWLDVNICLQEVDEKGTAVENKPIKLFLEAYPK